MTLTERTTVIGTVLMLVVFVGYWTIVIARAVTDGLPLTDVAWQGPLLLSLVVGGGIYAITYGVLAWRERGVRSSDERDVQILRYSEATGAGLTGLAVLASLIMLALEVDTFWVAQTLFVGSFLGSLVSSATTIAAYREGLPS